MLVLSVPALAEQRQNAQGQSNNSDRAFAEPPVFS